MVIIQKNKKQTNRSRRKENEKEFSEILAVTLGAATLLTGCGGNSGQKTSDSSKKSDDQKITEDVTKTEGEIEVWTNLSQEEMNFYVEEFKKLFLV